MDKKVKSLADLVGDILYENYCSSKLCENCKYNTTTPLCHIAMIIKIIDVYEKRCNIYEENNKNQ